MEKHEPNTPKQAGIGTHRDARGRWLPGVKQAPGPGRGYVGERSPQHSFASYADALRDLVSPELWAAKLAEACERGDMRALEYVGNRLLGMPHRAPEDTEAIRQAVAAQAQASALVVMVDGKQVESVEAQRAAARAMLKRFTQEPEPPKPADEQPALGAGPEDGSPGR